ncbi:MAG: hypothetical protein RL122_2475 [Pseudomonadota bacterium]|jgi:signal transduction histidine kinase|uniref:histidine kinase n=1 Tax=Thiothrix fructosivorans TaxID=111770 RepID=A0A8B0SN68_9GAMM|nr:ATP-binding protein [Thiothrix fructosivorans]MBO0613412.1 hypothetical protein [Thiothrix fructosivorans]QTX11157.1 hypothetical protein J1836_001955 [Thiothrix fructosivorans]
MKVLGGIRVFWWLPLYLLALYLLAQQLDHLTFAPEQPQAKVTLDSPNATRSTGTIRIPANLNTIEQPALLIFNLNQNIAVYYPDGTLAGDGGSMTAPIARNKHRPLLLPLYKPALTPGGVLRFELASTRPNTLMLTNVYLGASATLEKAYYLNNLLRQDSVKVLLTTLLLAALLIGGIWLFYPARKEYLWYAIGTALWGIHSSNLVIRDIPVNDALWAASVPFTIGLSVLALVTMVYYYVPRTHLPPRRYTHPLFYLWATVLVLALPLFILPYASGAQANYHIVWYSLLALLFSLVLAYVVQLYWQDQTAKRLLFVLCGFAMLVFGLHDTEVIIERHSTRPYLLHFAAMFTLLTQYVLLVRRFVSSLRETQYYANNLESIVAAREQELEANYQKIRGMEQEKAVVDERERIMRDIHDGFGGDLISTLAMLERPDARISVIKENIQDALNDLRLVIDSLDFDSQDITTALGMFRSRNSRKIKQAGFELRWAVEDIATPAGFGAEKTLQLLRIVQEAITNAIKHSGGNTITVSTGTDAASEHGFVQIADNGMGMPATYQPGKGLASMRKRAATIGAQLAFGAADNGSGLSIRIILH